MVTITAPRKVAVDEGDEESEDEVEDADFTPVQRGGKQIEIKVENLYKKLKEVLDIRGKKVKNKWDLFRFKCIIYGMYKLFNDFSSLI